MHQCFGFFMSGSVIPLGLDVGIQSYCDNMANKSVTEYFSICFNCQIMSVFHSMVSYKALWSSFLMSARVNGVPLLTSSFHLYCHLRYANLVKQIFSFSEHLSSSTSFSVFVLACMGSLLRILFFCEFLNTALFYPNTQKKVPHLQHQLL